jgi:hypothetical protein
MGIEEADGIGGTLIWLLAFCLENCVPVGAALRGSFAVFSVPSPHSGRRLTKRCSILLFDSEPLRVIASLGGALTHLHELGSSGAL